MSDDVWGKDELVGFSGFGSEAPTKADPEQVSAELAAKLVNAFFSASKTLQLHDLNNRAAQRALNDLMAPLSQLLEEEAGVVISVTEDFVSLNGARLVIDQQSFGTSQYLIKEMRKRDVEAIEFRPGIDSKKVGRFLQVFFVEPPSANVFEHLNEVLTSNDCHDIKLTQWVERERKLADVEEEKREIHDRSNQVFFRTHALMGEVLRGIEQRRAIQVRKAERLTQQMVDIIQADESILVGLSSIKKFDEYTFAHSVNVCILSMLMADRLRLYKSDIARLGVAALLHDIGKTYIPQTILNKPGRLADGDWELMKYHTFFGVKELSRVKAMREVGDALSVALQHHVHYNMNGYPQRPRGWHLRLFTRIVTIADYYDAMTTPRIYNKEPLTPDKALQFILEKSGQIFDPFIAKVFIQAMGVYPIGTVVELDTGEKAVVVRQNGSCRYMHRPFVSFLDGSSAEPIDLTEKIGKRYRRSVTEAYYNESAERSKSNLFVVAQ